MNRLANLQLLDVVVNNEKSDTPYNVWLSAKYTDSHLLDTYKQGHFIPMDVSYEFADFLKFIKAREKLLRERILEAFPSDFNKLVERYVLQDKLS